MVAYLLSVIFLSSLSAQNINAPHEIIKIMEKSEVTYSIHMLEEPIPAPDHSLNLNLNENYVIEEEGNIILKQVELSQKAIAWKEKAEKHYMAKEAPEARSFYKKILDAHPEYSKMMVYIGQTHELEGQFGKAKEWYEKALDSNPLDYMANWFVSRYYMEEGDTEKGLRFLLTAHVLNRNSPMIKAELQSFLSRSGFSYADWVFNPQVRVESTGENKVDIYLAEKWMGFAFARALWQFEPGYAESKGGSPENISTISEKEAILGYIISIAEDKKAMEEPMNSTLLQTIENKELDLFIIYEMMLPEYPSIAFLLPEEARVKLVDYILKYRINETGNSSGKKSSSKKKKKNKKKKK